MKSATKGELVGIVGEPNDGGVDHGVLDEDHVSAVDVGIKGIKEKVEGKTWRE